MSKSICIIPARGGSKRVPRKNVLPLNGIPLLSYTIRAAIDAKVFEEIIVSSEDKEIQELALLEGVKVDDRPDSMAGDTVTKVEVVKEYLLRTKAIETYDNVIAMLPTCPFRMPKHVLEAVNLFNSSKEEFLLGVTEYEFPVQLSLSKESDRLMKMDNSDNYKTTRSQNIEKKYHPNGAIYIASIKAFLEKETFFNDEMLFYEMSAIHSYDIDYPYQFEIAEILAKKIQNNEL